MRAYGKSKKVKVGPTVEETNVKTVEVSLSSPETGPTPRNLDQNAQSVSWLGNRRWSGQ